MLPATVMLFSDLVTISLLQVLRAAHGVKRPAGESEGGGEMPKKPRAKGKGKGRGKGKVVKEDKGVADKVETATGGSDADAREDHNAEATADAPEDQDLAEPAKTKKVRGPRKETPKEVLDSAWGEKVGEPSFLTLHFVILCCWPFFNCLASVKMMYSYGWVWVNILSSP